MTSLVAVLNKQAVALAADSAATTVGFSGPKIYNSVNKLFQLTKHYPVGIMVYSSSEVMGVPIETVIKVYREQLGPKPFATLEGYCLDFMRFLKEEKKLFPEEARIEQCSQIIFENISNLGGTIANDLTGKHPGWNDKPSISEVKDVARTHLRHRHNEAHKSSFLKSSREMRETLNGELQETIKQCVQNFREQFHLANTDLQLLSCLCLDLVTRKHPAGVETGFVVAGYGENEYFPQLRCFEFESSVHGIHKLHYKQYADPAKFGARVIAFAQAEMVDTFVEGRAKELDGYILSLIDGFFAKEKANVANSGSVANSALITQGLDVLNADIQSHVTAGMDAYTLDNHKSPIYRSVSIMPKEEMARMAQALVNLTAIKRRMSPDAETVGGPTDVAVISKGDGFVWIDRKHYFSRELNPFFGSQPLRDKGERKDVP